MACVHAHSLEGTLVQIMILSLALECTEMHCGPWPKKVVSYIASSSSTISMQQMCSLQPSCNYFTVIVLWLFYRRPHELDIGCRLSFVQGIVCAEDVKRCAVEYVFVNKCVWDGEFLHNRHCLRKRSQGNNLESINIRTLYQV